MRETRRDVTGRVMCANGRVALVCCSLGWYLLIKFKSFFFFTLAEISLGDNRNRSYDSLSYRTKHLMIFLTPGTKYFDDISN